ncbi:MAG: adenylate kinase [Clostridia bacterium]|nr:adenylate kinase [Clostridia bacterium]
MNIVLLGAPGAGKGTQAVKLAERYNIPHISTGDIFRYNIKNETPIGKVAKSYIDKGQLVPDEVTVQIVKERLEQDDCKNGYLLDGFPRTVAQAQELDKISEVDAVANIDVPFGKLMRRITGRRLCALCGNSYHIDGLKGKTTCQKCGGELVQRADDNEQTVKNRLDVYTAQTQPLIGYYEEKGKLVTVDGDGEIDAVFNLIIARLDK